MIQFSVKQFLKIVVWTFFYISVISVVIEIIKPAIGISICQRSTTNITLLVQILACFLLWCSETFTKQNEYCGINVNNVISSMHHAV